MANKKPKIIKTNVRKKVEFDSLRTVSKQPQKLIKIAGHQLHQTAKTHKTLVIVDKSNKRIDHTNRQSRLFAIGGLIILLASTLFWSILGAKINQGNADQFSNAYLFENLNTFHGSLLPAQHSFILKWPLFFIAKSFGYSNNIFIALSVLMALATIGFLAWIIYRIVRRPLLVCAIYLSLASVLLLIPTQPYAGGILPVNMAMLTTRNIEYALYISVFMGLIKYKQFRNIKLWLTLAAMVLLFASDRLFVTLMIGGAGMATSAYCLFRQWGKLRQVFSWFLVSVLGAILATTLLWLLNKVVHIVNQSSVGPYQLVLNGHKALLGVLYSILGVFTNLGANPAYDATIVRDIPSRILTRVLSPAGFGYLINSFVLLGGSVIAINLLIKSLVKRNLKENGPSKLALMLIWSNLAAIAAFIFTDHYYAVDSRYLSLSLFTVFICIALRAKKHKWSSRLLAYWIIIAFVAIISSMFGAVSTYKQENSAMNSVNTRNKLAAQALVHHGSNILVGDYWRVMPIRLDSNKNVNLVPLSDCTTPSNILSSNSWQNNLKNNKISYLLSFDDSLTGYPRCNLQQIIKAYGRPNGSALIDGTLDNPKEILLFYDGGLNHSVPIKQTLFKKPATVLPTALQNYPHPQCKSGHTIMNIVAHQDDDLLFINPDTISSIKSGYCVRTVYITAGDGGHGEYYWLGREQGSQSSYDFMDGPKIDNWTTRIAKLNDHQYINISVPQGNPNISLIFMRLPDGNINGHGFRDNNYESLVRLEAGIIQQIHSVDKQSYYSSDELTKALLSIIEFYKPDEIHTQANYISKIYPDHSDHMAVGRYVKKAIAGYSGATKVTVKFYIGYPIHAMNQNVFGDDITDKKTAFFSYAKFDDAVCKSDNNCSHVPTYGSYLVREYQNAY